MALCFSIIYLDKVSDEIGESEIVIKKHKKKCNEGYNKRMPKLFHTLLLIDILFCENANMCEASGEFIPHHKLYYLFFALFVFILFLFCI